MLAFIAGTSMPRAANVLAILIASPSDVDQEREIVTTVIQEWNPSHSKNTGIVLEPVRWETHTFPSSGERPQAIVDKQIVDDADAVIGIFGYRLGTPTGEAQSGTIEEIERLRRQGKQVSLYFSTADVPRHADRDQLQALEKYQEARKEDTLFDTFRTLEELRSKVTRHLPSIVQVVLNKSGLGRIEEQIAKASHSGERVSQIVSSVNEEHASPANRPLGPLQAVSTVKQLLTDPAYEISLHDLVLGEAEKVQRLCDPTDFPFTPPFTADELRRRTATYESITLTLQAMLATGCYWGNSNLIQLWVRSLERVSNLAGPTGGPFYQIWWELSFYPALLCLYSAGIAAVAREKYEILYALAWQPTIRRAPNHKDISLVVVVNSEGVLGPDEGQALNDNPQQRVRTPVSNRLFTVLRQHFSNLLLDDLEYTQGFLKFEYFISLMLYHYHRKTRPDWPPHAPLGSYIWQDTHDGSSIITQIDREFEREGSKWAPLRAGLFDGSTEVFKSAREGLHSSEYYRHSRWR